MRYKKQLSLFLSIILILSLLAGVLPSFAVESSEGDSSLSEADGLCVHHPQHTAECGYAQEAETQEVQTCGHIHDESCGYVAAAEEIPCQTSCVDRDGDGMVDHRADCTYQPATEEVPCDMACADTDGDGVIDHREGCTYRPATEEIPCDMACADTDGDGVIDHQEGCAYQPAGAEVPCDAVCVDTDGDGIMEHGEGCAYQPATEEIPCDAVCTDTDGDGVINHQEGCGYQPAQEGSPCTHQHDESCGWTEESEAGQCIYAVNGCSYCVTGWSWPEEQLSKMEHMLAMAAEAGEEEEQKQLEQTAEGWVLTLPGVSADNPLTQEVLVELLPGEISATTDSGGTLPLALRWDLTAIPQEGVWEGNYTLTAALADPAYALTEDAAPLAVEVQLDDAELYTLTLPWGTPPYPNHYEYGVSPSGTTIDLFDYWLTGQTDSDNVNPSWIINQGINNGHALLFGDGMKTQNPNVGSWNHWTGDKSPWAGIVSDRLVNGYPQLDVDMSLASDTNFNNRDGQESLAYLFDPNVAAEGKASYPDVKGLLQVDSEGYYYYNSQKNYAVYYPYANEFTLYDLPGVKAGGQSPNGQFFPFNAATSDGSNGLMNNAYSNEASINHYFGLHMSTRFIQQNGGYTDRNHTTPVTYTFSGDDDVWIFIDGVLVADLGGIHDAASVTINFVTGAITINGVRQRQTLGSLLGTGSNTLPDDTYHTLDFFYLERGNVDSNMYLKYNLVTIPESDLIKIDQMGDPVPGAEFSLYAADAYAQQGVSAVPIATGVTDATGEFVFLDENDFPITIQKLYDTYGHIGSGETGSDLVLVETYTPPGYRTTGDTGLYFYETTKGEVLLLSNSVWDQGAYAMAKVTATTPNRIRLIDTGEIIPLMGTGAVENPLMFAVVLQKQSNGEWRPISGDPLSGWTVQPDSSWDSVLAAARSSRYMFQLASSGAYQVEISNLPGDIKNYYHICLSEETAEYTVGYYYSTASSLGGATADNTHRIDADPSAGYEQHELERVFSMELYVSNLKNNLIVQKVDELGNPVNGAQFSLYAAEDVTITDGKLTPDVGAVPLTLTTASIQKPLRLDGGGVFQGLHVGEYYLVETVAPKGYERNETPIHVLVDDTGVYADAGTAEDGVTVLRGAGSVVRSMLQFAADDSVDATLNGIKAALAQDVTYIPATEEDHARLEWGEANWDETQSSVLHLKYANANGLLDYGLYDTAIPGTLDNLTLATDVGWSKLLVRQCLQHNESISTERKTDLGDQDITGLFSTTSTVRVENARTGDLTIAKTVSGDLAPTDKPFSFTVTVTDGGTPVSGTFVTRDQLGAEGSISFVDGTASFTLLPEQSLTILDLPADAVYRVEETDLSGGFGPAIQVTGDETSQVYGAVVIGTVRHTPQGAAPVTVQYTNVFDGVARVVLNGTKTMMGRPFETGEHYLFTLTAGDDATRQAVADGLVVLPQSTEAATADSTTDTAAFRFEAIIFKAAGTYLFHIREQLPESGAVQDGIWYDTHTATATVTVVEHEESGMLSVSQVTYFNAAAVTEADGETTTQAAFTNRWAGLTLSKEVTGTIGNRDKAFAFQITLTDGDGKPLTGRYQYTGGVLAGVTSAQPPENGTLALDDAGTGIVHLKHGQTITLYGLPSGSRYTITEPDAAQDGYTTTVTVDTGQAQTTDTVSGSLSGRTAVQVAFCNRLVSVPATGIWLDHWPWLIGIGVVLAGAVALLATGIWFHRRRYRGRHAK